MSKRKTKKRTRWSEEQARRVLGEQRASGKSVAAFAEEKGLDAERIYRWRRRLGKTGKRRGGQHGAIEFAEVVARPCGPGAQGSEQRFEVLLSSGRRVWVPVGFVAEDMKRLVAVLEGPAC